MGHLRNRLRIFLFRRKVIFRSQDIQLFLFLTIQWFTKSVTSRWMLVYETGCIFEYVFWTTTRQVAKLGQLIDINKEKRFRNHLNNLEDWGRVPGPFRFSNLHQFLNSQLCQDSSVSFFFEKVNEGHLKTVNVNY